MRPVIFPYNIGSEGARLLARALDTIRIRRNGTYVATERSCIVNWGNSDIPRFRTRRGGEVYTVLNHPNSVGIASDKLRTFQAFRTAGVPHPEWTTDRATAARWFQGRTDKVVCRTLLRASDGRGITVAETAAALVPAPLYVRFFPKQDEYRVHVFRGEVIDAVQKRLRNGERGNPNRNRFIRSHSNGWVFAREGVVLPRQAREVAIAAARSCGLDFGAVDLAVNDRGTIMVFEVNTAPGIEGHTVQAYADAVRRFCNT
jgi:glutathione synthase/RimK-type ligase-like ATP-grasp enzyme